MTHAETALKARVDAFGAIYENRNKQAGSPRKTVGYVSFNVPVEIIEAAGCVPLRLTGRPLEATPKADVYMDACFDGSTRSLFEQFLQGDFASLDLVIIPRTSENYLQLYYFLLEVGRLEPDCPLPPIYLFDLLQTPYRASVRYVRDQIERLKMRIEATVGQTIDESALADAIQRSNHHLDCLNELAALRHASPTRLHGETAIQIIGSLGRVPRETHLDLLRSLLDSADALPSLDAPRLIVKGCAHDNANFYRYVESCGAVIVEDDHLTGQMAIGGKFDDALPPLDALTHRYRLHSPSLRRYPQSLDDERFVEVVKTARADAVIFFYEDTDDVLGWDYPDQKARLDELNVPSLRLLNQSYRKPTDVETRRLVAEFVDSLRKQRSGIRTAPGQAEGATQ
jgi:benzoyl-CoA reductase/2-hydroxyglutaryl-CoA dehydratase subunit BcrC/BadD/HgdB